MKKMIPYAAAVCLAAALACAVQGTSLLHRVLFGRENRLYASVQCMAEAAAHNGSLGKAIAAFCAEMGHEYD